jgi:TPR repeat protein
VPLRALVAEAIENGAYRDFERNCSLPNSSNVKDIEDAINMLFEAVVDNRQRISPSSFRRLLACAKENAANVSARTKRQIGMLSSPPESGRWLRQAAEADDAEAALRYARMLQRPSAKEKDEYDRWINRAADLGHPGAQCAIGLESVVPLMNEIEPVLSANKALEARRRLTECAENTNLSHLSCSNLLSDYYRNGEAACRSIQISGMTWLGRLYAAETVGFSRDSEKAAYWLNQAIAAGDHSGALVLSKLYQEGDGVARDQARANQLRKLYQKFRTTQVKN